MKCNLRTELNRGIKTEMEHAHLFPKDKQLRMVKLIAKDHLKESPCYYKELSKMEKRFKR